MKSTLFTRRCLQSFYAPLARTLPVLLVIALLWPQPLWAAPVVQEPPRGTSDQDPAQAENAPNRVFLPLVTNDTNTAASQAEPTAGTAPSDVNALPLVTSEATPTAEGLVTASGLFPPIPMPTPILPIPIGTPVPGNPSSAGLYGHLDGYKLDDIYFMQPHNSYDHGSTLTGWLDAGFRTVELDVIDRGDWENDAAGPYVSHDSDPGNKNCSASSDDRLGNCLGDLVNWLNSHPNEGPLLVFIDMKASWDPASAWYSDEVKQLDQKVYAIVGNRMYTADALYTYATGQVYPGTKTLRQAVSDSGWPVMGTLKGKLIVAYTGGRLNEVNQGMGGASDHRDLPYGFYCPDVEDDEEELQPGNSVDGIDYNDSQTMVCSNLKARDHYQVTANMANKHSQLIHLWGNHVYNNDGFTYNYIAAAHGISAIGRDANTYSDISTFGGKLPYVGTRRPNHMPGYFALQASYASNKCMDVEWAVATNGQDLMLHDCHYGTNQKFVYTAEGQLRPQLDNRYCVDIDGGKAQKGKQIHLWDCDGGNSEKWDIEMDSDGLVTFRSKENSGQCLDIPYAGTSSGTKLQSHDCNGSVAQKFRPIGQFDWAQVNF